MQPCLFSVSEAAQGRPGWVRAGHRICYYRNLYTKPTIGKPSNEPGGYNTAEFTITFRHEADVCYIAYHFPYTYTSLQCHMAQWAKLAKPRRIYWRTDKLCQSLAANPITLLTITALGSSEEIDRRDLVFLSSRVHPGEANSSWMMHGWSRRSARMQHGSIHF